jgi:hypothetical protein
MQPLRFFPALAFIVPQILTKDPPWYCRDASGRRMQARQDALTENAFKRRQADPNGA